jgi:uncharacterized protein
MIIADTSGLLAFFNRREPRHADAAAVFEQHFENIVVSPFVVAELDYLVASRLGVESEVSVIRELAGGAYDLAQLDADDLTSCALLIDRYADQDIGISDASIIVLAERHRTTRILTLDRRHFDVVRPISGGRFDVLPR